MKNILLFKFSDQLYTAKTKTPQLFSTWDPSIFGMNVHIPLVADGEVFEPGLSYLNFFFEPAGLYLSRGQARSLYTHLINPRTPEYTKEHILPITEHYVNPNYGAFFISKEYFYPQIDLETFKEYNNV